MVAVPLLVVAVALILRPPPGRLLAVADYENGQLSQWTGVQAVSHDRAAVVRSPVRQGHFSARFESRGSECLPMDCGGSNPRGRAEAFLKDKRLRVREGDQVWYHWYSLFPTGGPTPECTFSQWRAEDERARPGANYGLYGLLTVNRARRGAGGEIVFQRNGDRWRGPLRRGAWTEFLVHVSYSSDSRKGLYELWVDGRHAVSFHDRSKPPNTGVYFKQGVYRNVRTPSATVFDDDLRIATTRFRAVGP